MAINKQEWKYIIYSGIFAIIYFFLILPYLIKTFDGDNPIISFLIFNLGIVVILAIYLKSRALDSGVHLGKAFEYLLVVLAMDVWAPGYHVGFLTGQLTVGEFLGISTTDYFFGYVGQTYLHLAGILVSIWTYLVVPIFLLYLASRISKSNFVNRI